MEEEKLSANRNGNFTSSDIIRLTVNGKRDMTKAELDARPKSGVGSATKTVEDATVLSPVAINYINEKNKERKLQRSLSTNMDSRPTTWGKVLEKRVLEDLLGTQYQPCSNESICHPEFDFWWGTPDAIKHNSDGTKTVVDIKCPYTLASFCDLVESTMYAIRNNHKTGEQYYWQLVSNAILTGADSAELIVYCPYESELPKIKELVDNWLGNPNKVAWINFSEDSELPYLIDGAYYKNLNICSFPIFQEDKDFLTLKVKEASRLLIPRDYKRED